MVLNTIFAVLIGIFVLLGIAGLVLYLMIKVTVEAACKAVEKTTGEIISCSLKGAIKEVIEK